MGDFDILAGAALGSESRGEQTFSVGQGLLRLLEGVLSQEGLGRLQHRVDERPARLDILHESLSGAHRGERVSVGGDRAAAVSVPPLS